jgi:hypothetical protein
VDVASQALYERFRVGAWETVLCGLGDIIAAGFWHEVFSMLARFKPGLRVTLRAKELPDEIIQDALKQGLNARIETKY